MWGEWSPGEATGTPSLFLKTLNDLAWAGVGGSRRGETHVGLNLDPAFSCCDSPETRLHLLPLPEAELAVQTEALSVWAELAVAGSWPLPSS